MEPHDRTGRAACLHVVLTLVHSFIVKPAPEQTCPEGENLLIRTRTSRLLDQVTENIDKELNKTQIEIEGIILLNQSELVISDVDVVSVMK
ncbi:uncharacterized [Tachysurus ichikawai]